MTTTCILSESTAYISASANRHSHAADISPSGSTVAFGSSKLIAFWDVTDPSDRGVYETLPGHDGLVTCVQFVREDLFVSADDKGWASDASIQAHDKAISSLCVFDQFVTTGSSDASVKIWNIRQVDHKVELSESQIISLRARYPLALALTYLPQSKAIILAIAATDQKIHVYTCSENTFVPSVVLPGHEDWVRALAFRTPPLQQDALVLASGSQDGTIRLWNVEVLVKAKSQESDASGVPDQLNDELLDAFEASLGDLTDAEEGGRQISLKRHVLTVKSELSGSQQFTITFDALLIGHEAGVTSLSWSPSSSSTPTLLSTSTDSSLILWSPSTILASHLTSSIWINRQRFGDVGGQRLGGFVGGLWARGGNDALAWGWNGGWRRWQCASDGSVQNSSIESWTEIGAIGGHNGPVKDIDWSPQGEYLISVGIDQTTRIHGATPVQRSDNTSEVWHELGRPQVHGYDIVGAAFLDPWRFASIADEKIVRVFEAPRNFINLLSNLNVSDLAADDASRPFAASVPPLGLSNKATSEVSQSNNGGETRRRPYEGELVAITLWPEIEKVFGHGYESISLAVSTSKRMLATSCKATSAEHAVVRVYDVETWRPFGSVLAGHTLTVTRIAFSPDDRYILSVSRDRTWRLFEKGDNGYLPIAADKSHGRIIWDCAWSHEGDIFATASRDKTVKIWTSTDEAGKWTAGTTLKFKEAATSVAFCPKDESGRRWLAVGSETGEVFIHSSLMGTAAEWDLVLSLDNKNAHVDHVHRLAWRATKDPNKKQLASCSEDGTLKILIVQVGVD
ncbi:WD40-repeat-containing domain protein [Hygrophoropsis aurantiaca]|uniref:WD40-repeat-containing domain protein n=1 Tax=Hygrophoropsis aurantiaca TaxID=72124 RepID=A0ACB8A539_9AGAM|nr:WD40-repeat-containing domain protein [Hygrophoropsis aurantiaca]